tara:strand:- start:7520 stop:8023 length:504 start_codon:yes stop_codon:yes gene_type:complete
MAYNQIMMTSTEVSTQAINDNYFDTAYFDKYILTSQRKYVKPVLGKDYYNELLTQIAGGSLTTDNTIIVDNFIKPMLAHYIVYEVYSKVHTQLTNQGAMENNTEQSNQANNFEYSQSRDFYINKADFWKKDMIEYIKEAKDDDSTKFPLFDDCDTPPQVNKKGIIFY